jgi:Integrase core domain
VSGVQDDLGVLLRHAVGLEADEVGLEQRAAPEIRTPLRALPRSCLDWILVRGRRHLQRVLRIYADHYNTARPHRGLDLATPDPSPRELDQRTSDLPLRRRDLLGGLIHEYERAA